MDARRAAEQVARHSYGRLVAYLATRFQDVAAAEDALGDAFLTALNLWPQQGVPQNPEAWLLVTARRRLLDWIRHSQVRERVLPLLTSLTSPDSSQVEDMTFPDDRLQLLFVCAHPAIDPNLHTPLMLQTVLGLTAAQIASAFLVAPATMGQRLVRAKAKIRDAGIGFELPQPEDLPGRLGAVLEAIYAAYTHGWEAIAGCDPRMAGLAAETIWLARLCVQLLPQEPEARGLLALLLHCEARRPARRTPTGTYIPLSEQDVSLWSQALFDAAEHELAQAARHQRLGRFQLEAAIQSVHSQRLVTGCTDWPALAHLYAGLLQIAPTLGAQVSYAAAIAEAQSIDQGLQILDRLPTAAIQNYQPYWAVRASLLQRTGQTALAQTAYQQAIGLTEDAAVREFLWQRSQTPQAQP